MADVDLSAAVTDPGDAWDQGDIVDGVYFAALDKKLPAVLVTPACDIEQAKVDVWTLIALFPDVEVATATSAKVVKGWNLTPGAKPSKGQETTLANRLRELIGQRLPRYHWIPIKIGEHAAHVVDFSYVTALPADEIKENAKRLATLRSSWREQVPARYTAFMGRVGTLDFKGEALDAEVERLAKSLLGQ